MAPVNYHASQETYSSKRTIGAYPVFLRESMQPNVNLAFYERKVYSLLNCVDLDFNSRLLGGR